MPVPSQGHCGFPSFQVVDWFCLFVDLSVLPFPLEDCSVILLLPLFNKLNCYGTVNFKTFYRGTNSMCSVLYIIVSPFVHSRICYSLPLLYLWHLITLTTHAYQKGNDLLSFLIHKGYDLFVHLYLPPANWWYI